MTEILYDLFSSEEGDEENHSDIPNHYAKIIDRVSQLHNRTEFGLTVDIHNESEMVKIGIDAWQKAVNRYRADTYKTKDTDG